jgi:hypothetical protein
MSIARDLLPLNPAMTFIYASGVGTDSTERGRVMWARVKGRTENALLRFGFKGAYMFRPGLIVPMHGIRSRTTLYRVLYTIMSPLVPAIRALFPNAVTTTGARWPRDARRRTEWLREAGARATGHQSRCAHGRREVTPRPAGCRHRRRWR